MVRLAVSCEIGVCRSRVVGICRGVLPSTVASVRICKLGIIGFFAAFRSPMVDL